MVKKKFQFQIFLYHWQALKQCIPISLNISSIYLQNGSQPDLISWHQLAMDVQKMLTRCCSFCVSYWWMKGYRNRISWQLVACLNICNHFLLLQKRKCQYKLLEKDKMYRGLCAGRRWRPGLGIVVNRMNMHRSLEWPTLTVSWIRAIDRLTSINNQLLGP